MPTAFRDAMAQVASPEFDALKKFSDGDQAKLGPKAGLLSGAVSRFVEGMRAATEQAMQEVDVLRMAPEVEKALARSIDGSAATRYRMDFRTHGYSTSRIDHIRDLLSSAAANGMERVLSGWERADASPGSMRLWMLTSGGLLLTVPNILPPIVSVALSVGVIFGVLQHAKMRKSEKSDDLANELLGHEITVRRRPLGTYADKVAELHRPSPEFLELARAAMFDVIEDKALTERQYAMLDTVYTDHVMRNEPTAIRCLGVEIDTLTGVNRIVDANDANHLIAVDRQGVLSVVDAEWTERMLIKMHEGKVKPRIRNAGLEDVPADGILHVPMHAMDAEGVAAGGLGGSSMVYSILPVAHQDIEDAAVRAAEIYGYEGVVVSIDGAEAVRTGKMVVDPQAPGRMSMWGVVPSAAIKGVVIVDRSNAPRA